ncbi:hypothetical protein KSD_81940 [Ktedonobacter sp. SOSP1-85]|uniref:hypothetical protein n=1 Tax=Ktedonobacter sp. SOSP1-85 TaxID=2778367 RepID=UPI001916B058|nr:hypothetical protein [Ktedonobacter sp. SOSP1-85]GHO80423.1 hypothetical protein KSD_81940 [Ktedonobacter sp. SOSP1-85]
MLTYQAIADERTKRKSLEQKLFGAFSFCQTCEQALPYYLMQISPAQCWDLQREDDGSQSGAPRPDENNGCVFRDKINDEDSNVCIDHPDR